MKPCSVYSKKVLQHFKNPKNMGEMKNADAIGKVGNPTCGDTLWVYLKIEKNKQNKEYIKDIKFQTFGCIAAIAVSSILTEMIKGKTLEEAKRLNNREIVKKLGGLPPIKYHCSLLGAEALHKAIDNFRIKNSESARKSKDFRHYKKKKK